MRARLVENREIQIAPKMEKLYMKKKTVIFVLLILTAIVIIFIGYVRYASALLPVQDPELAPVSVFIKQERDIMLGKIMMLTGTVIFTGSMIGGFSLKKIDAEETNPNYASSSACDDR